MTDKKILCVDDEETITCLLSAVLGIKGFSVVEANDGSDALKLLNHDIGLLITDITMPGMDGYQLSRAAREYNPYLPIVMITAHADPVYAEKAREFGIDDFLTKPFNNEYLWGIVGKYIN